MSGAEIYFISGCAVESDIVYLATQLEDVDSSEYTHTRMSVYVGRFEASRQWFYHDVDANIVSVCNMRHTNPKVKQLVALSKEGEVELWTNQDVAGRGQPNESTATDKLPVSARALRLVQPQ